VFISDLEFCRACLARLNELPYSAKSLARKTGTGAVLTFLNLSTRAVKFDIHSFTAAISLIVLAKFRILSTRMCMAKKSADQDFLL